MADINCVKCPLKALISDGYNQRCWEMEKITRRPVVVENVFTPPLGCPAKRGATPQAPAPAIAPQQAAQEPQTPAVPAAEPARKPAAAKTRKSRKTIG